MNIILFRLIEYLGHPNPFICAVVHTEVSVLYLYAAIYLSFVYFNKL